MVVVVVHLFIIFNIVLQILRLLLFARLRAILLDLLLGLVRHLHA